VGSTIGVDIGGTKCLGVVLDDAGRVRAERRLPTPRTGPELVTVVDDLVEALVPEAGTERPAVGVGAPGLVTPEGVLRFAPNLPGIVELPLAAMLGRRRPGGAILVDNDATCAAWAEVAQGAAVGATHVLMVTIGTGIGGGLVVNGRLHRGRHGFAGEIGHMIVDPDGPLCPCGQRGCWERYASGSGLGWMAREAAHAGRVPVVLDLAGGDAEDVRGEHVTTAAAAGDPDARAVMARFAWWVARGLANLANVVDPVLVVLGGGMAEAGEALLEPARTAFAALIEGAGHRPDVPLVVAALGERAGAVGAALLARRAGDDG
jgi:glucokinase